eukprot:6267140-Pyramimonas_sp.AAC.1
MRAPHPGRSIPRRNSSSSSVPKSSTRYVRGGAGKLAWRPPAPRVPLRWPQTARHALLNWDPAVNRQPGNRREPRRA